MNRQGNCEDYNNVSGPIDLLYCQPMASIPNQMPDSIQKVKRKWQGYEKFRGRNNELIQMHVFQHTQIVWVGFW
ncbi:hypothetical protein OUZ56_030603 [Daphnia magna]|uniref:Uncharacterized protein n=1 Tax=Daphnia magna TaxID=35525 RepID=A0ABQ9ZRT9_9CRUS|nr:hypothetical protein OUZ56_030603 [Daphnia magna]